MTTYSIIEINERTGRTTNYGTFEHLSDAISRLRVFEYSSEKHGRIIKSAVKSFTWEFLDEHYTAYRAAYKIVKSPK